MSYIQYIIVALALLVLCLSCGSVHAAPVDDLHVVGISTTDGSSIRLGIEPGAQRSISFCNVTWYVYGSGEVVESVDDIEIASHQVDGLLIIQSSYDPGQHAITFSCDGQSQQFVLTISESASAIDWDELAGKRVQPSPGHAEVYVWIVSILSFLAPLPLVYRRVRRRKRLEVVRIV